MTHKEKNELFNLLTNRSKALFKGNLARDEALANISVFRSKSALKPLEAVDGSYTYFEHAIDDLSGIESDIMLLKGIHGICEHLSQVST